MLRVTGGRFRGRRLAVPRGRHTRPTADRVREAVFSTLARWVDWERTAVLDLFAGTGALGIEALSRGAPRAVFVERHARTAALLRENLAALGVPGDAARVVVARAEAWLQRAAPDEAVGLVLLDPPYAYGGTGEVLARLAASPAVADGAVIVVEGAAERALTPPAGLACLLARRYGDTQVRYLRKAGTAPAPPSSGTTS